MRPDTRSPGPAFRLMQPHETVTISYEGKLLSVCKDVSVAAALLAAGYPAGRLASNSGAQRSAYCGIGQCFECSMVIDGIPCRQTCLIQVQAGMHVARQAV